MCFFVDCNFNDFQEIELIDLSKRDPLYKDRALLIGQKFINDQCPFQGDRWFPINDTPALKKLRKKHYDPEDTQSFFFFKFNKSLKVKLLDVKAYR